MSNNIIIGWHIYLHKVYATPRDRTAVLSIILRKNYNKLVFNEDVQKITQNYSLIRKKKFTLRITQKNYFTTNNKKLPKAPKTKKKINFNFF